MGNRLRLAGALALAALYMAPAAAAQARSDANVPGNPGRGAALFREQRCIHCHSFHGAGGSTAPDLGRRSAHDYTPHRLAAVMWNHAPAMWQEMAVRGVPAPALEPRDVSDLYAYFFSVRYFDRGGDAGRGKALFDSKSCARCHSLRPGAPRGGTIGPPVSAWNTVMDPVGWLAAMWNHSATMFEQMERERISWPDFTGQELADLLVYFRSLPETRSATAQFSPSDPEQGRGLFAQKTCGRCHAAGIAEKGKVQLPRPRNAAAGISDLAAAMWNHAPLMQQSAARGGAPLPALTASEMNHLVGYLISLRFFEEQGDAGRGRRVFAAKKCASCHQKQAVPAPALSALQGQMSAAAMTSALWKHGPRMLEAMKRQGYEWPQLTGQDMADVVAYLNRKP